MASTPVSAAQPLANAFSSSSAPTACTTGPVAGDAWVSTTGSSRSSPTTMTVRIEPTKTTVGRMNARALCAMPRRFTAVTNANTTRHSCTVYGSRAGNAEVSAATPAAIDTATLST